MEEQLSTDEIIAEFNRRFPKGARVRWRSLASDKMPHREYTVLFAAVNHYGRAVAWFVERAGMVSVEPQFVDYQEARVNA